MEDARIIDLYWQRDEEAIRLACPVACAAGDQRQVQCLRLHQRARQPGGQNAVFPADQVPHCCAVISWSGRISL